MSGFSETRRQAVHMAMGLFALALRYLTWWQAAACAVASFLFNLFALPLVGGASLYRPVDAARGYPLGILFYPLSVLVLVLAFPRRPDIVASAWGIMAVGDGAATIVGRRVGGGRLPWNEAKTVAGTVALAVAGGAAGVALAAWTRPAVAPLPPLAFVVLAPLAASCAAALVESLPVRLDDNISVPITAGIVLGALGLMDEASVLAAAATLRPSLALALAVNVPVAFLGWRAGGVTTPGAVTGAIIGILVLTFSGLAGWALLFASFVLATASTRLGLARKAVLGIAEERGGRRGPGNAIANTGLAALAAAVAGLSPYREGALLVMVAALAAGASDTVASEVGKVWGRRTFLFPSFRPVRPGTSGAVSVEGTAAGVVSALGLSGLGVALGLIPGSALWFATIGATIGGFVESGLGATLEARGLLNNDMLNFINTGTAAAAAVAIAWLFR
ncbi:MAG: putative rane protein [Acidobacteria bacterium]|nr:putative rane protein [Acidobacteriota bacterium]